MPLDIQSLLRINPWDFFSPILAVVWQVFKSWWWLPAPFILWRPAAFYYLWWRTDKWLEQQRFILLEIKIPKEVLKPIKAMETVMASLYQSIFDPPDWWEKWVDGKIQLSYSFEIVSLGGEPHFFIRIPDSLRDTAESAIYSQYPEVEITAAEDYTKFVPKDIPNKDWDLWGADYKLLGADPYPIKTYPEFEKDVEPIEEKRIDPMASLLEAMAKINPGEQLWVQILATPVTNSQYPWITEGKKIRDELARRIKKESASRSIFIDAVDIMITGNVPKSAEVQKEEGIPVEMKLTPGERETISAVENKISKPGFKSAIRFIYLGKNDVFYKPKLRLPFSFFASFLTENLNRLVPYGQPYLTKVKKSWFLPLNLLYNSRLYLRKRKLMRQYILRVNAAFPKGGATFILNTEEMATIFHFPGKTVASAPSVQRIESKRGEAPPGLPTE